MLPKVPHDAETEPGDVERLFLQKKPSLTDMLLAIPESIEFERDHTPMREIDL
jgi:hypothetical protein